MSLLKKTCANLNPDNLVGFSAKNMQITFTHDVEPVMFTCILVETAGFNAKVFTACSSAPERFCYCFRPKRVDFYSTL